MQIFAAFEQSIQLELAITNIQKLGIDNIYTVPLDSGPEDIQLLDTINRSDGLSLSSVGMVLAVFCSVIGAARGFDHQWGPIVWGIIGAIFGLLVSFIGKMVFYKVKMKKIRWVKGKQPDIILIIECADHEGQRVEKMLWEHAAIGVGKAVDA